jgi:hypothetical protein
MAPSWDDRHPFATAEVFRTSTCTGEKMNSLGGISAALGDLNMSNIHDHVDFNITSCLTEITAGLPEEKEVLWDDRRPFFTAKNFETKIALAPHK